MRLGLLNLLFQVRLGLSLLRLVSLNQLYQVCQGLPFLHLNLPCQVRLDLPCQVRLVSLEWPLRLHCLVLVHLA